MPVALADRRGLGSLTRSLRAIADRLDKWRSAGAQGAAHVEVTKVAQHFDVISKELRQSGARGERLGEHLDAIATNLRAAADALGKSR